MKSYIECYSRTIHLVLQIVLLFTQETYGEVDKISTETRRLHYLPICTNNSHVAGRWTRKSPEELVPSAKSFFCCSTSDYMNYPNECGSETLHIDAYFAEPITGKNHSMLFHSQFCDCDKADIYGVSEIDSYKWSPQHCHLHDWDASRFCDALGNRTILFIGDSTMLHFSLSLMSMIATDSNRTSNYKNNCNSQLMFARSWYLTFRYNMKGQHEAYTMEEYAMIYKPDILVMGVGAHLQDMGDLSMILSGLEQVISSLRAKLPRTKLVWKTMAPGHLQCEHYTAPIEQFHLGDPHLDQYHWNIHQKFDEVSRNFSRDHNLAVLDVAPIYLRPDAHPPPEDCLHFCVPGPLNLGANILMQMLINKEL